MTALATSTIAAWDGPAAVAARGTLIVVPGRGEYPSLYERLGTRLAFDAYRVRAVVDPTRDAAAAQQQIAQLLDDATLPAPHVLVGSDTGSLFAAGLVAGRAIHVDGLILAGAASGDPQSSGTGGDWETELSLRTACSTHQARLRASDTLVRGAFEHRPPAEWFAAADLPRVEVPVLALHGSDDAVSPVGDVAAWYAGAPAGRLVRIVGGRHDVLNDAAHRTVAATIVLFLERLRLGEHLPLIAQTDGTA